MSREIANAQYRPASSTGLSPESYRRYTRSVRVGRFPLNCPCVRRLRPWETKRFLSYTRTNARQSYWKHQTRTGGGMSPSKVLFLVCGGGAVSHHAPDRYDEERQNRSGNEKGHGCALE